MEMNTGGGVCDLHHRERRTVRAEPGQVRDPARAAPVRPRPDRAKPGCGCCEVLAKVEEMLECVGADVGGVVAEELPHNRWLSPGVAHLYQRRAAGSAEALAWV